MFNDLNFTQNGGKWRETYAEGLIFDFGKLLPKSHPRAAKVPGDRGEWVLSTWGCDVVVSPANEPALDSGTEGGFDAIKGVMPRLVGSHVRDLLLEPGDLSLTIRLSGDHAIRLKTDAAEPDMDQWFIELPSGLSVGASSLGRWYVRPANSPRR